MGVRSEFVVKGFMIAPLSRIAPKVIGSTFAGIFGLRHIQRVYRILVVEHSVVTQLD